MRCLGLGLAAMALASLVAAAPAALAEEMSDESMPRLVITLVCTVYGDYMDDAVDSLELLLGVNVAEIEPECEMSTEYIEGAALPPAAKEPAVVTIPEGALFPPCADTNACFSPYTITVESGDAVTWVNKDTVLHTVTGETPHPDGNFDSWMLPGKDFTFEFETVGEYPYHCSVHPWAKGVVVVSDAQPEPEAPASSQDRSELAYGLAEHFIDLYAIHGDGIVDEVNAMAKDPDPVIGGFLVQRDTLTVVAHSTAPEFVGFPVVPVLQQALIPVDVILEMVETYGDEGVWITYPYPDSQGNFIGFERGWFKTVGNYIIGARYSVDDAERVKSIVDETIRFYNHNGTDVFDRINGYRSSDTRYPLVLDLEWTVVAHSQIPKLVGVSLREHLEKTISLDVLLEELQIHKDGLWTSHPVSGMTGGTGDFKLNWLQLHDDYIFVAGYEVDQETRVKAVVNNTIRLYDTDPARGFERITSYASEDPNYPFVLDLESTVVAHGSDPDRPGATSRVLTDSNKPKSQIMEEIQMYGGTWVEYAFTNPATGMEEHKRSWVTLHDGYIFGAGYYP